jgi:hypothetical protein
MCILQWAKIIRQPIAVGPCGMCRMPKADRAAPADRFTAGVGEGTPGIVQPSIPVEEAGILEYMQ